MGVVTPEIVKQVAHLARLDLEGNALSATAKQLDMILEHVQQLSQVPTDGVEPTSHVLALSNVLRRDEPRPSLKPEQVTAMAPVAKHPFIAVLKVIEA